MPKYRPGQKYKHLFFDLDNTLFDFDGSAKVALNELFNELNLDRYFESFSEFFSVYEPINLDLWSQYKESLVTKDDVKYGRFRKTLATCNVNNEDLVKKMAEGFLEGVGLQKLLIPGTIELLEKLKPWYNLHIISNGFTETQHNKLQLTGLDKYFDKVVLSEQVKAQKPSKVIFTYALTSANAKKSESLMIGDNFEADIVGAKNFGIDQAFFAYSKHSKPSFTPTYTVTTLDQLLNIV